MAEIAKTKSSGNKHSAHDQMNFTGETECPSYKSNPFARQGNKARECVDCGNDIEKHQRDAVYDSDILKALEAVPSAPSAIIDSTDVNEKECPSMGGLYLGGMQSALNVEFLKTQKISVVVNAAGSSLLEFYPKFGQKREKAYEALGENQPYHTITLEWVDSEDQDIDINELQEVCRIMHAERTIGKSVLVHCAQGKSRSTTVVMAYLFCYGTDDLRAKTVTSLLSWVQERRSMAKPNQGFLNWLEQSRPRLTGQQQQQQLTGPGPEGPASHALLTTEQIEDFHMDGAIVVRGIFDKHWIDVMKEGADENMSHPSIYASENHVVDGEGRFFDDYCNWNRIPAYERIVRESPAARLAAQVMKSNSAQFFHDHLLVKEPNTSKPTPWHMDAPYYFVEGSQTVSMWIPLDSVEKASLRFIAGSHKWDKLVRPVSWADDSDFYSSGDWLPVPDPDATCIDAADAEPVRVLEYPMEPGDVVLFHYHTVHGARGNAENKRRRALSLRWLGDDAVYVERPGKTSPPYPGHDMKSGQKLREDWFPIIYRES